MCERENEIEEEGVKIQSRQGMIKVKTRIEVRMDGRLRVRTRKSRNKKEALGD